MQFNELPKHFAQKPLRRKILKEDPFEQLLVWCDEAKKEKIKELNAMALATATSLGKPSCRMVLLKKIEVKGATKGLHFFTPYESRKALEMQENPFVSGILFWKEMMRQVCIEGTVEKLPLKASKMYFDSRPRGSQLAAWVSLQGTVLTSKKVLEEAYLEKEKEYEGKKIPLPPNWGGFRIIPQRFEFWQGGEDRLHDRFQYTKEQEIWCIERLSP